MNNILFSIGWALLMQIGVKLYEKRKCGVDNPKTWKTKHCKRSFFSADIATKVYGICTGSAGGKSHCHQIPSSKIPGPL